MAGKKKPAGKKNSNAPSRLNVLGKHKADIKPIDESGVSDVDLLFIDEYMTCLNASQAYRALHPDVTPGTARVNAHVIMSKPLVRAEIKRRFAESAMSKEEVLKRLSAQADASLFPFVKVEDDGHIYFNFSDPEAKKHLYLIKKLKSKKLDRYNEKSGDSSTEKWVEVELHDSQKALELLGRYHALFTDKTENTEKKVILVTIRKDDA